MFLLHHVKSSFAEESESGDPGPCGESTGCRQLRSPHAIALACAGVSGEGLRLYSLGALASVRAVNTKANATDCLTAAGLAAGDVEAWLQTEPGAAIEFSADRT